MNNKEPMRETDNPYRIGLASSLSTTYKDDSNKVFPKLVKFKKRSIFWYLTNC